jgi:hypothetical protein
VASPSSDLTRVLSWLLIACQLLAVGGVVLGLVVGGAGGRLLSAVGVLTLLGGPYLALVRIAVSAGKRRSTLAGYAVGTLAIVLLGAWLAR